MTLGFTYYSPTVGAVTGWSENLGTARVRLATLGLSANAEQGEAAICSIMLDDPDADVGHLGDAIVGFKQMAVTESACPVGRRRIWTGYTADRNYARGQTGNDASLIVEAARTVDVSLTDMNSFLSFRVFRESDAQRPAETDTARVAWLLGHSYMSGTLHDHGLVASTGGVDMDAADYRGQKAVDILNDCAQQSGRNYFVYYDEPSGDFSLWYHKATDMVGLVSTFRLSNVLSDVDNATTFAPTVDTVLARDPSRVVSGVYLQYNGGAVYRDNVATATRFGARDMVAPADNVTTTAQANARADRLLSENSTEDDRLTVSARLPKAHVNDWYQGEAAQVRFSHLPGYEDFRYVRALRRTVQQDLATPDYYLVEWECTPLLPAPSGAFGFYDRGGPPGQPVLPHPTTPGRRLIAFIVQQAQSGGGVQSTPQLYDDGNPVQSTEWDFVEHRHASYTGTGVGPVAVTFATRLVFPGEVTTTPVSFLGMDPSNRSGMWLWEIGDGGAPTLSTSHSTEELSPPLINNGYIADGSTWDVDALTGFELGCIAFQMPDYGGTPSANAAVHGTMVQRAADDNNPALNAGHGWNVPWVWIGSNDDNVSGLAATIHGKVGDTVPYFGAVGIAVVIPGLTEAPPTIPFPANQVG